MKRLIEIAEKPERTVVGIMSGTSHDSIDVSVAKIIGSGTRSKVTLLSYHTYRYDEKIRKMIRTAFNGNVDDVCRLNFELGEAFADAALKSIEASGFTPGKVDIIASHGQTVYHVPPERGGIGCTLQIGEASVIAERTGIITVSDFRTRDMAAGGQGAPLVPLADYILLHERGAVRAVQNIGGIANVTVVTEKLEDVIAFDTGPGNSLIDDAVRLLTDGMEDFDRDGKMASAGKVDAYMLKELMNHPYLSLTPPKSTGRELFGKEMAHLLSKLFTSGAAKRKARKPEDLIATLTRFTAESIFNAYERFIFPRYKLNEIILTGGGSRNPALVGHLKGLFSGADLKPAPALLFIDELGIPSAAKEALSFAILGNETISGNPGNLTRATGAKKAVVLGKISL